MVHGLYEEGEDREAAADMTTLIIANGRPVQIYLRNTSLQPVTASDQTGSAPIGQVSYANERLDHSVAMRLKDADQEFSGDIGESWLEFVDKYEQIGEITTEQNGAKTSIPSQYL